jgi:caa(3)-type oxidase subunit IV
MDQKKPISELRRGVYVFAVLAVLTALEYWLGTSQAQAIFLWAIAILKAALVAVYFMHIGRLFSAEGGRD